MPTYQIHEHARTIADMFIAAEYGGLVTYAAMTKAIGQDVKKCRHYIYQAQRVAEKEDGAVFQTETRSGYRRLHPQDSVRIGPSARSRIRSTARRANEAISAVIAKTKNMPADVMRKQCVEQGVLGTLEIIAQDSSLPPPPKAFARPLSMAEVAKDFLAMLGTVSIQEREHA